MADGAVVAFAATILERDDLFVLALLEHLAGDRRAFDQGRAVGEIVTIAARRTSPKDALSPDLRVEKIYIDDIAGRDAMLPSACFDDCKSHGYFLGKRGEKSHAWAVLTSGKLCRSAPPAFHEECNLAFRRVRLVVREQLRARAAAEFLELLR